VQVEVRWSRESVQSIADCQNVPYSENRLVEALRGHELRLTSKLAATEQTGSVKWKLAPRG